MCVLMLCLFFVSETKCYAENTKDSNDIDKCIKEFVFLFENVNNEENVENIMTGMSKISVDAVSKKYMKKLNYTQKNNDSYLEMVMLLLQRRQLIEASANFDLSENNKKINVKIIEQNIDGNVAKTKIRVLKTWHYSFSKDVESAAEDEYTINLRKENSLWKIQGVSGLNRSVEDKMFENLEEVISSGDREKIINKIINNIDIEKKVTIKEMGELTVEKIDLNKTNAIWMDVPIALSKTVKSTYNTRDAVLYAFRYATSPNKDYYDFTNNGGDCTNFVSQCLYAGGIKQHIGTALTDTCWFYKTSKNRSSSWTGAKQFKNYITNSKSKINMVPTNFSNVFTGDVIQLVNKSGVPYHTLFVNGISYTDGKKDVLVCAHTANRRNVALSVYYGNSTKKYYHIKGTK